MYKTKRFETVDFADRKVKEALATWVPDKMLAAAESLQTEFQALLDKDGARNLYTPTLDSQDAGVDAAISMIEPAPLLYTTERRSTLYVEEGADACQVCDVDSVVGPGSGLCETTLDVCAALSLKRGGADEPVPAFDYDDINFEPSHIILGTLTPITTRPTGNETRNGTTSSQLIDAMDLRDALRAWLRDDVGLPGTHVTVYSSSPDEFTSRWLSEGSDATSASAKRVLHATTPSCPSPKLHHFTVAFVAHDQGAADMLAQALQEDEDDEGQVLPSSIASFLAGVTLPDTAVCIMGSTLQRRLLVPAYNSHESLQVPSFFQTPIEREKPTSLTSAIRLVDPTRPGLPFAGGLHQDLVLGKKYSLLLSGFPPVKNVDILVVGSSGEMAGTTVESFSLTTNDKGGARYTWAVPPTSPPGDYFLQASEEGREGGSVSPWGFSSVYTVAAKARRRKLYGPIWWVVTRRMIEIIIIYI